MEKKEETSPLAIQVASCMGAPVTFVIRVRIKEFGYGAAGQNPEEATPQHPPTTV